MSDTPRTAESDYIPPSVWDDSVAPGGYVCPVCKVPTESEPCAEHQRDEIVTVELGRNATVEDILDVIRVIDGRAS